MGPKPSGMPTWMPDWSVGRRTKSINPAWTAGISRAEYQYIEGRILRVDEVLSAIMRHVENLNSASDLYKDIFAELK